jgi:hypothetical protein
LQKRVLLPTLFKLPDGGHLTLSRAMFARTHSCSKHFLLASPLNFPDSSKFLPLILSSCYRTILPYTLQPCFFIPNQCNTLLSNTSSPLIKPSLLSLLPISPLALLYYEYTSFLSSPEPLCWGSCFPRYSTSLCTCENSREVD